jgi:hypothetical protein
LDILHAPVVYAHNDLLSGNLMLNDLEGKIFSFVSVSPFLLLLICKTNHSGGVPVVSSVREAIFY